MRIGRLGSIALATGTAVAVTLVPAAASAAPATVRITEGSFALIDGVAFDGMQFYAPPSMTVHQGDTLTFRFGGFHTATLLPVGDSAEDWRADNATGPGAPYSFVHPDTDDSRVNFELNKAALFPSPQACGAAGNPCSYDGTEIVNSGSSALWRDGTYSVTITAAAGQSFWVICLVHPMMQTRITVVADTTDTTTQDEIDNYTRSTLTAEHEQAAAMVSRLDTPSRHRTASGRTVWDAFAGYDGNGWALDGMFPHTLRIAKGQRVRWHFAQLAHEVHTVTFPKARAKAFANNDFSGNNVKCEGSGGDTPADLPPPDFCRSGPQDAEFVLRGSAVLRKGSSSYTGHGLHSSGLEGPDTPSTAPYTLTFPKASPRGGYAYACSVHGTMMSGRVVVR